MLERDHPTIHEGHCLIRILYAWWDVGKVKWVVERIAKNDEAVTVMCAKYTNPASVESRITITKTSVAVAIAIRIGVRVTEIDPGFSGMAACETVHSLARRTPCEPDRGLRPLQRTLRLLHAAGIAGMVASRRSFILRRNAAPHPHRRRPRRNQSTHHRWRTVDAPWHSRFHPGGSKNSRRSRCWSFDKWNAAGAGNYTQSNDRVRFTRCGRPLA